MDSEPLRNELLTSQWTGISPGNIYYSGGNVGIGTITPVSPLQINSGDNYVQGISFSSSASGAVGAPDFMIQRGPSNNVTGGTSWNSSNCMVFHTPNELVATTGPVGFLWMSSSSRIGMFYDTRNTRLGIGTTNPTNSLHVVGSITTGGWLFTALNQSSCPNGNSDLNWITQQNNRVSMYADGIRFNIPDPGMYVISVQLNADTSVTATMTVALYNWTGTTGASTPGGASWNNMQNSEWYTSWTTSVETRCQFFVYVTASTDYKFQIWNGSGATFAWAQTVVWSRMIVYKVG